MNDAPRERLWTWPLVTFLLLVAGIVGWSVATRHPSPDLDGAVELLADGDLDRDERDRMLRRILDLAPEAETLRQRWAAVMAAVALEDAAAFRALEPRLEAGPARVLPPAERAWLDLGDAMLANVLRAMSSEAAGDRGAAAVSWRQVREQARLTHHVFAGALAAERLDGPK